MAPQSSRLKRNLEKQTKKQIYLYFGGIILIIFLMLSFGGVILGGIGDIIFGIRGEKETDMVVKSEEVLNPPLLLDIPKGTSSDTVTVNGKTEYTDGTIEIMVNSTSYKDISVNDNGEFKKDIKLVEGENIIKVRVKKGNITSEFSDEYRTTVSKGDPKLDISFPSEGQEFTKADQSIDIKGKTEPINTVTVNGFRAIVDSEGEFSFHIRLSEGDNIISIEATNPADKKTKKDIKVIYKP